MRVVGSCLVVIALVFASGSAAPAVEQETPCSPEPTDMPILPGTIVNCTINPIADTDLFRFQGTAGTRVLITLSDRTGGGAYPSAGVYDPGQQLIATLGVNDTGMAQYFDLGATGTYTILVRESGNDQTVTYNLALQSIFPPSPEALSLCYDCTRPDTIQVVADSDLFVFTGEEGHTVMLTLTDRTGGGSQPLAEIFDPDRISLGTMVINDTGQRRVLALEKTGTYTVVLREYGDDQVAYASLSLQALFPPGAVPCLGYGSVLQGAINPISENDVYLLPVGPATTLELTLTDTTPGGAWTAAEIFDGDGVSLTTLGANDVARTWTAQPPEADLYIVLLHENGDDQTSTFNLGLQCIFGSCPDSTLVGVEGQAPFTEAAMLRGPFPNPATAGIFFGVELPREGTARIGVYSVDGAEVAEPVNQAFAAGLHSFRWSPEFRDGRPLPNGVYYLRLQTLGRTESRRFVLNR